jgi:hypothetical protein
VKPQKYVHKSVMGQQKYVHKSVMEQQKKEEAEELK